VGFLVKWIFGEEATWKYTVFNDLLILLQGVLVFVVLVCKRSVYDKLKERLLCLTSTTGSSTTARERRISAPPVAAWGLRSHSMGLNANGSISQLDAADLVDVALASRNVIAHRSLIASDSRATTATTLAVASLDGRNSLGLVREGQDESAAAAASNGDGEEEELASDEESSPKLQTKLKNEPGDGAKRAERRSQTRAQSLRRASAPPKLRASL